jgi:hypothetical protein
MLRSAAKIENPAALDVQRVLGSGDPTVHNLEKILILVQSRPS